MEQTKMDKILANQEILNKKLDIIIAFLKQNNDIINVQMVVQGLALGDLMRLDK
jgi:hypothetical protein